MGCFPSKGQSLSSNTSLNSASNSNYSARRAGKSAATEAERQARLAAIEKRNKEVIQKNDIFNIHFFFTWCILFSFFLFQPFLSILFPTRFNCRLQIREFKMGVAH